MTSSGAEVPIGRLVLDTSAYSWMRSGHAGVLDLVAGAEIVILTATVLGELEGGFELGSRQGENRAALAEFMTEPFVRVRHVTPDTARRYGKVFAQLRNAGTPIPVNDMWIAATTLECGGHLLTFDAHYRHVPGLAATVLEPA